MGANKNIINKQEMVARGKIRDVSILGGYHHDDTSCRRRRRVATKARMRPSQIRT